MRCQWCQLSRGWPHAVSVMKPPTSWWKTDVEAPRGLLERCRASGGRTAVGIETIEGKGHTTAGSKVSRSFQVRPYRSTPQGVG